MKRAADKFSPFTIIKQILIVLMIVYSVWVLGRIGMWNLSRYVVSSGMLDPIPRPGDDIKSAFSEHL